MTTKTMKAIAPSPTPQGLEPALEALRPVLPALVEACDRGVTLGAHDLHTFDRAYSALGLVLGFATLRRREGELPSVGRRPVPKAALTRDVQVVARKLRHVAALALTGPGHDLDGAGYIAHGLDDVAEPLARVRAAVKPKRARVARSA